MPPILAELGKPEIFGKVAPQDPTVYDSPLFWSGAAALALLVATTIWLLVRHHRAWQLELARKDPEYLLRLRLEHSRRAADQTDTAFHSELASIMRCAIGLSFEMSATPRTARELEQMLVGRESATRAGAALVVIKECEAVLFSGAAQSDREDILIRAVAAFNELLPNSLAKMKKAMPAL